MEINSNLWYIKFYLYLHSKSKFDLPKDICSLRNQLIKTLILFLIIGPFWLTYVWFQRIAGHYNEINPWYILYTNMVLAATMIGITFDKLPELTAVHFTSISILGWYIGGLLFAIAIGLIITACVLILTGVLELYPKLFPKKEKKPSAIKTMYKSWKEKYCTKITWK